MNINAQPGQILNFEKLTINDGLSQGYIYNIAQDEKGFMWFCTPDGLNRYDGYSFKVYRRDDEDSFSISSNLVTKFFIDTHKNVWVATNDNGLNLFDIPHQKFYHFFKGLSINDVLEDRSGNLVITNNNKIILAKIITGNNNKSGLRLDTTGFVFSNLLTNIGGLAKYNIFSDVANNIFVSTDNGIFQVLTDAQDNKAIIKQLYAFTETGSTFRRIIQDKSTGKFYIGLNNKLLEFADANFKDPLVILKDFQGLIALVDDKQRMWFRTEGQMWIMHLDTNIPVNIIPRSKDIENFFGNQQAAFQDRNGNIWLGTSAFGLLKYSDALNIFHHMLPDKYVYRLTKLDDSTVTVEDLLKIIFKNRNQVRLDSLSLPNKLYNSLDHISRFIADSNHNLWLNSFGILKKYDPFTHNTNVFAIQDKISRKQIHKQYNDTTRGSNNTLFKDKSNNIWFQYQDRTVSYNIRLDSMIVHPKMPVFKDPDKSFEIMYEDANGILWCTSNPGFFSYDPVLKRIKFYQHIPGDTTSVASDMITCFCDDPAEPSIFLWVGTRGSGLSRLNKATGKCMGVSTKNGLPNNVIYGLLADDDGNVWGSSNKGLFRIHALTGAIESFDVTDGLQGNEFNRFAYLKLNDTTLIFGGVNGINYFNPKDVKPMFASGVELISIKLLNKNLAVNEPGSVIDKDVSYLEELNIKSNQNIISFEFAALDYKKAGSVLYRYKLKGFNEQWNDNGINNTVTYTNLDPGNYAFYVQASNDNINWSKANLLLRLRVLPMWWQTWLFKVLIACCLLVIGYSVYRYRLTQLLKIERVRNNIAKDLHDEIGSTLSSISIYSKVAQKQMDIKNSILINCCRK